MTRFDSEGDSGDYRLASPGMEISGKAAEQSPEPVKQAAGYDLQGIGGQEIHDVGPTNPQIQGRGTRKAVPIMSHPGEKERESDSDYNFGAAPGFRFRQKFKGV